MKNYFEVTIRVKADAKGVLVNQHLDFVWNIRGDVSKDVGLAFNKATGMMEGHISDEVPVVDFKGKALTMLRAFLRNNSVKEGDLLTVRGAAWKEGRYVHIRVGYTIKNGYLVEEEVPYVVFNTLAGLPAEVTTSFEEVTLTGRPPEANASCTSANPVRKAPKRKLNV